MFGSRTLIAVLLLAVLADFVPCAYAQFGKNVPIPAGSEVDHQLAAINSADPAQKLALIEQFSQAHPDGDFQVVANEQYVNYYLNAKQYDKAFEYGDKLFALDPGNYSNAINMIRAANEKGDTERLFSWGERANSIVAKYKDSAAPEGTDPGAWDRIKSQNLDGVKDSQDYVRQSLVSAAYNTSVPEKKAGYFERIGKMYADTPDGAQALTMAALSYQQAQNRSKMLEVANAALVKDPDNLGLVLLLADDFSERADQVDKAESYAKKAIALTDTAKKPGGVSEDQWKQQLAVQRGLALSALGQVNLQKKLNTQAVDNLSKAAPLLKSNPTSYARNQYRLGFAYLNLKKNPEAKQAFTDAAAVDSPYRVPAQQKVDQISAAKTAGHKKPS